MDFLNKYTDQSYAIFRIVLGFLFLCHGTQKLFGWPIAFPYDSSPLMMAAGVIEALGGAMIIAGFFSRIAAFICSGTMAVAYWMVHGLNDVFPIANGGELAVVYCFAFLFIAAKGPGIWSVNNK